MFPCPHLSRDAHSALDFVENKHDVRLVADLAQLLIVLCAEMVVSAFTLDRLDNDSSNTVRVAGNSMFDLLQ